MGSVREIVPAARLRPFLVDPLARHRDADHDCVGSLTELAALVARSPSSGASTGVSAT
jgi:hypothetical protein